MLQPGAAGPADDAQLVQCAVHVATAHFPRPGILVVSASLCDFSAAVSLLIILLNHQILWAVENVCGAEEHGQGTTLLPPKPSSYILLVAPSETWERDFTKQVLLLRERTNWNANAAFLILLFGNTRAVDFVFSELWHHMVSNAAVVVSQPDVSVLAWFPISFPEESPTEAARWEHGQLVEVKPLFARQVAVGRLENLTLRAATFDWPPYAIVNNDSGRGRSVRTGVEVELLRAVSGAVGFRLLEEALLDGNNWPELLKRLNEGTIDVGLGGFIPYPERYIWFDASASYLEDRTKWFVTPPRALTVLECVFHVFRPRVWTIIFGIYVVIVVLEVVFASSNALDLALYRSWPAVALDSWRLLVDSALHALPVTTRVRLLVAAWILGSMHINQAFRSVLTSSLSRAQYERSPRSLDDLVKHLPSVTAAPLR
ncbi:uncharacterized protein LOC113216120 isoform X2 [Frankliniella occidentalis]|uniref:Uncharacterized protein LOC113216120 isoform X2 n=1 Tax=Frankliniella occidentalis TaxID=133901 RepID=A0A9C6X8L3_FRAOC|nr:uncharacterized protein LOC113216120 isoform X2 [Frankliniella occidentalis]